MAIDNNENPWKGLNFYVEGEFIYGRDAEILSLSHYIFNNSQTVLYGRSGIGKSSILNAGIFPEARAMGMIPVVIRLKHDSTDSYIDQIRKAFDDSGIEVEERIPVIDSANESIWEFMHRHVFLSAETHKIVTPLLVFDQFEEIFTLQSCERIRKEFFNGLADLLNDVKPLYVVEKEREAFLQNADTPVKIIETASFKGLNLSLNLKNKSSQQGLKRKTYFEAPSYHIVFVLREDFLSYLEVYASSIPVMRNNRFALQPINEEQAAEIIMKPREGLVSKEVAKLIIEKVTGRTDFALDGKPEIEVPSAILSLYLSRLYDKMVADGKSKIDKELVENHSADIIEDFYLEAIKNLPNDCVERLENTLINPEGRRDNRDKEDVLKATGLSEQQLNLLIDRDKILRQFPYDGNLRIEYIHDVLCPVVLKHRKDRDERIQLEALQLKAKRKFCLTIIVASILVIGALSLMWFYMSKPMTGLPHKQSFLISFLEDSLTNENDYWKGDLSIIGHRIDAPDTILFTKVIDKGLRDSIYKLEIDTLRSISFSMKFSSYSKYQDISFEKDYSDIIKMLNVQLQLKKKRPKTYPYFGNVSVETNGIKWPIQNALICLHDITTRTDSCGNFRYSLEKEVVDDDDIFIIKKGFYSNHDFKAGVNDPNEIHEFLLLPKDSIQTIKMWVASIDSLSNIRGKTIYRIKNQKIYKKDGSMDVLNLLAVYNKTADNKYYIEGYFYFNSDLKKNRNEDKYYSYYILTGEIDRNGIDGYKNYSVEGTNYIGNIINITGTYKQKVKQKVGTWTGELSSPVGFDAYFPQKEDM